MRNIFWQKNAIVQKSFVCLLSAILVFVSISPSGIKGDHQEALYQRAWQAMLNRIIWTVEHIEPARFPMLGDNTTGIWEATPDPKWTGGFWVGMIWLAYDQTRDEQYREWAEKWNEAIIGHEEENNHDRGFVYYYSSAYAYKLTRKQIYRESALRAADKLVTMSEKTSKVIPQNQVDRTNIIIDTMVNLELLWWAASETAVEDFKSGKYYQAGIDQAITTKNDFIRPDGSTWQSVHYDTITGEIIKKHSHQGYTDSTCWSRGQSWGLYGFIKAYLATRNPEFMQTAIKLGDYIIKNLPEDGVPWYDYNDPGIHHHRKDTSAGAIAASAFIILSNTVSDQEMKFKYIGVAHRILKGLISGHLTPFVGPDSPVGILRNGCYQIFANSDSETIWGDYYLMEALAQILFDNPPGD